MRKPTSTWIDRICLVCGTQFKCAAYIVKRGDGKYCSRPCRNHIGGKITTQNSFGSNNLNWKGGVTKNKYAYKLKDKIKHPEKHRAREIVKAAKKNGKLIAKPCEVCGSKDRIHAHHEDYSKPLNVKWLCAPCHIEAHN